MASKFTMTGPTHKHRTSLPPLPLARVSGQFAFGLVLAAQELGANLRDLGDACGIRDLSTKMPESISVIEYLSLLRSAAEQLSDPLFGLHAGEHMRVDDAAGYSMVLLACKNFRMVAEQLVRFESLSHDLGRSELVERDGVASFRWHSPWLDLPGGRHLVESMAACTRAGNNLRARTVLPVFEISFTHSAPTGLPLREYERVLLAPVRFDAEFNEARFSTAILDLPVLNSDASLMPMLVRVAEQRLQDKHRTHNEASFIRDLRAHIREKMKLGQTSLEEIAIVIGVGPRTLQRQLAKAGLSYARLLDDVRREMAQEYLVDRTLSLTEIALLLGYREQSSFVHGFRKWFGVPPSIMRRKLLDDDGSGGA